MKHTIAVLACIAYPLVGFAQFDFKSELNITFTAMDSAAHVQLDSIKVMNRTQGGDTVLHWPDTALVLDIQVDVSEFGQHGHFRVFPGYPNPASEYSIISIQVPEKDAITIIVTDHLGRIVLTERSNVQAGKHTFRFDPGKSSFYLFTVQYKGKFSSVKILTTGNLDRPCSMAYVAGNCESTLSKRAEKVQGFPYNQGDELLYIGYADTLQSGISDTPLTSETITFQFAFHIPCPGMPTVEYRGHTYKTIQVYSQCWLKENLNIGTMIGGMEEMADNGILEKYCYHSDTNNCAAYGGLYPWDEMMQYIKEEGARGICPEGWHIPTDEEWKILEGAVDTHYGIGNPIWDVYGLRGFDAGMHLKSTTHWYGNGNGTDHFGFTGLPGGYRYSNGYFYFKHQHGLWWSSTEGNASSAWNRYLSHDNSKVDRDFGNNKLFSFSVRCIRDD
jgi:uncharacterized protein (TIGR02145 family)